VHPSEFDTLSSDVRADPRAFFKAARDQCPVYHDEAAGTRWLTRYDDIRAASRRVPEFTNVRPIFGVDDPEVEAIMANGYPEVHLLIGTDPPEHTRHRKLLHHTTAMLADGGQLI
jgi:cytochrome P450